MLISNILDDSERTPTKAIDFNPFVNLVPSKIHLILTLMLLIPKVLFSQLKEIGFFSFCILIPVLPFCA